MTDQLYMNGNVVKMFKTSLGKTSYLCVSKTMRISVLIDMSTLTIPFFGTDD